MPIGLDHIDKSFFASELIKIAKVFNMKIYCNTLNPEKHQDLLQQGVEFVALDTLLSNSDIITVNMKKVEI